MQSTQISTVSLSELRTGKASFPHLEIEVCQENKNALIAAMSSCITVDTTRKHSTTGNLSIKAHHQASASQHRACNTPWLIQGGKQAANKQQKHANDQT